MRLKITINTNDKIIPFEYHGFIQAAEPRRKTGQVEKRQI